MKRKTIATLVRVGENYSYVSRSFEKIDDEALATIRGCIMEDNEETFSKEEMEKCFQPSFATLKEDYDWLGEDEPDFERQGQCIWEYYDGIECIRYILHISIVETEEKPLFSEDELELLSLVCHDYKDGNRGCPEFIRPVMELEKKLSTLTDGAYEPDTTYDV